MLSSGRTVISSIRCSGSGGNDASSLLVVVGFSENVGAAEVLVGRMIVVVKYLRGVEVERGVPLFLVVVVLVVLRGKDFLTGGAFDEGRCILACV